MNPSPTPFVNFDLSTIDWKVIIGVLAFVVALITLIYFQWWRNRRRFSYEVISNNLLISNQSEIRDELEIRFAGEVVKDVRLIVIRLINDGSQPIKKDEFQGQIKIAFPNATVFSAETVKSNPKNLGVEILIHNGKEVCLTPVLFNRNDYIQFKVLLSAYESMNIDARIVGVSEIKPLNKW